MQNKMSKLSAILLLACGLMGLQAQSTGTFTDSRNGKVYKTVKIGEQVWMAENLAYNPAAGNALKYETDADYADVYGYLYDWKTAMKVCPKGWRLPTDDEWAELSEHLGGEKIADDKLKETGTTHWKSPNAEASNESGFTALPGGARLLSGSIVHVGERGNWWSASEMYPGYAWTWSLFYTPKGLFRSGNSGQLGYSVRCIKDEDKWNDNGILVNHLGFTTKTSKFCMLKSDKDVDFEIINAMDGSQSFAGTMKVVSGDFGVYAVGDFSSLQVPGSYKVKAAGKESKVFLIDDNVYQEATRMHVNYLTKQRCGNTTLGWRGEPCHIDDGKRLDNGAHQDVSGGWHDAHDVRKWTGATIYGIIGLYRVAEVLQPAWDTGQIVNEMQWGNQYFTKMQEPEGYMMNYAAGNDGNYWSDNIIGNDDDRPIHTEPASLTAQFNFINAQAAIVRHTIPISGNYAKSCEKAARKCLQWAKEQPVSAEELASGIIASISMYRTFKDMAMMDLAAEYAEMLLDLQVISAIDTEIPVRGFFKSRPGSPDPFKHISRGDLPLIGLCELIEEFPEHKDASKWKASLQMYCYEYLVPMSKLSAFGIIPYGLYYGSDPGGNRRLGNSDYYYRYSFRDPAATRKWHVGINALLASTGTGLVKASKIFQDPVLLAVAQRQIDWIYGANIFNASTVTGFGHNVPDGHHVGNMQPPKTPDIIGGVMNGIAGHLENDSLYIHEVHYEVSEYWTPMVAYTMWLESLLMTTAVENRQAMRDNIGIQFDTAMSD